MNALVECAMNVSEGRDHAVIRSIQLEIESQPETRVLDVSSDTDHNRTVITFVSTPDRIVASTLEAIRKTIELVSLVSHRGVHPRIGAADVIPFVPLQGLTLADCAQLAVSLGNQVWKRLSVPVYFYGAAAFLPARRELSAIRRGGFEMLRETVSVDPTRRPDVGLCSLHATAGACAIGARGPLIAFNVELVDGDLQIARQVARKIREGEGGLQGVRALGFFLESRGRSQVSTNLLDYRKTSLKTLFRRIASEARALGALPFQSEVVGLVPRRALDRQIAEEILLPGFGPHQLLESRILEVLGKPLEQDL